MQKLNIETNAVLQKQEAPANIKDLIPDGAIYFEGVVSNGDFNRNGYIIDSNAWFFDGGKFTNDFIKNGSVLFNHEADKPIGRPLSFSLNGKEIVVTGYVFDDVYTNGAIGRGLLKCLSTGHITHERMFEKNGKRISEAEYFDLHIVEMFSDGWHQIVTKAEIAEFSFVTIPSNRSAVLRNSLAEEYAERKGLDKNEVLKNIKEMKLNETTEVVETGDPVSEVVAEPEVVPAIEGNAVEVETNEVATLSAKIAEMETNFASKLSEVESNHAKVIADMETNFATRLEQATEAIRSEERNSLAKVVTEGAHSNVKTAEQFRAKYA